MTRVALYARYSSDNQREASIEDQLRLCRLHAERQSWTIIDSYQDRAVSGPGMVGVTMGDDGPYRPRVTGPPSQACKQR